MGGKGWQARQAHRSMSIRENLGIVTYRVSKDA